VPDLEVADGFLQDFGLETGEKDGSLVAQCPGRDQEPIRLVQAPAKRLHHVSFTLSPGTLDPVREALDRAGTPVIEPPPGATARSTSSATRWGAIALSLAAARPDAVRRIVLMGSMGVAMALPAGLNTVWGYTPGVAQMREVIGLFAHDRGLITDELIELRYQASLSPAVRDSWAAMFPEPRQRWVDDLALAGAELAAISVPVLLVHGRDDRVVPWRVSSAQLADLLPDSRMHVLSGCGHWTMIENTADFLAVV
jgi:hypothetical protein